MRTPALLVLVLTTVASNAVARPTSNASRVRLEGRVATGRVLVVEDDGSKRPVYRLPAWVEPDAFSISPSGRHALVFAKLKRKEARTATIVDVSNAASARITGAFKPGVGGWWQWSPSDSLILVAGCGTSCATVQTFDVRGNQLSASVCDGFDEEHELSKDRRHFVCFSASARAGGDVVVTDTMSGRVVARQHVPCGGPGEPMNRDDVRWDTNALSFTCTSSRGRRVVMRRVAWEN